MRAPAFSYSAPGDAEGVALATQVGDTIVSARTRTVKSRGASRLSTLLPVGDGSIQVRAIDPDSPQARRPNGWQVPGCNQVAKRPGTDAAIDLRGLEIEKASRCASRSPTASSSFATRLGLRLIDLFDDWRHHGFLARGTIGAQSITRACDLTQGGSRREPAVRIRPHPAIGTEPRGPFSGISDRYP